VPEGDAVWRTARSLDRMLSGHVLTRTDFRVPKHATVDLSGEHVRGTFARGKHLFTRIGERFTLHTHLKMEGSWRIHRAGDRWGLPAADARVVLATHDVEAVGFSLGVVELLARDMEGDPVAHLGPDLLGPDWDEDEAVRRLLLDPERTTYEALLDQGNLAGIGNVYASELCFLAGVQPETPVAGVPDLRRLVRRAKAVLEANKERPEIVTTGDLRRGQRTWVYGRQRQACKRCGTAIASAKLGAPGRERTAFWCPSCQPGDVMG
jgi:endonuclease-8